MERTRGGCAGTAHRLRYSLAVIILAAGGACTTDGPSGREPSGASGSGGTGASSGAGASSGMGASSGTGASSGSSASGGSGGGCVELESSGNTCESWRDDYTCCTQGTLSVGSEVSASGFDAYEGRAVHALFIGLGRLSATDSVEDGAFGFDFLLRDKRCNLGASSVAGGALYVDADDSGDCDPELDLVFMWTAMGGPQGACRMLLDLDPRSPRCTGANEDALAAARNLCPSLGSCPDFCGRETPEFGNDPAACPTGGGAGGESGQGGQGGEGGSG